MIGDLVRGQIANSFHEIQEQTVGVTENTKIKNSFYFSVILRPRDYWIRFKGLGGIRFVFSMFWKTCYLNKTAVNSQLFCLQIDQVRHILK